MGISTAIDPSARARALGLKVEYKNFRRNGVDILPQRLAIIAQGSTSATFTETKFQATSASQVGNAVGFGSPAHLAALEVLPANGVGGVGTIPVTIYPLDDALLGVASTATITPDVAATGTGTFRLNCNGTLTNEFVITTGDSVATICTNIATAYNAILEMPSTAVATATEVTFTSKWKGVTANDIKLSVEGDTDVGTVLAIVQATGGSVNPDVQVALDQVGSVWETMVLNGMDIADTVTLDKLSAFGEGRWGAQVYKPLMVFTGNTISDVTAASAVADARPADRTNAQLVAPGSSSLPIQVAARQLAQIVVSANSRPASDYGSLQATGLVTGTDGEQWDYVQRDFAMKRGSSTIELRDGVVTLQDIVTFYHPTGETDPAYRHVVDIVKIQNVIYAYKLEFLKDEWDGAPLIPDGQVTNNPDARTPSAILAASATIIDGLGLAALISDPEYSKANQIAEIDETNPKRANVKTPIKIAGNLNIISYDIDWGFYFGQATN